MSSSMNLIHTTLNGTPLRGSAEAMGRAVAITESEFITAKAGFLGRWGNQIERYSLATLRDVQIVPNPAATLLALQFEGKPSLTLMFALHAQQDLQSLLGLLRSRLDSKAVV